MIFKDFLEIQVKPKHLKSTTYRFMQQSPPPARVVVAIPPAITLSTAASATKYARASDRLRCFTDAQMASRSSELTPIF